MSANKEDNARRLVDVPERYEHSIHSNCADDPAHTLNPTIIMTKAKSDLPTRFRVSGPSLVDESGADGVHDQNLDFHSCLKVAVTESAVNQSSEAADLIVGRAC